MLENRQFTANPGDPGGTHGWDDTSPQLDSYEEGPMPDMRAIFLARGPGINTDNKVANWIKLVDEYQVFCYLLGIQPEHHNGTWARVYGFLKHPPASINEQIVVTFLYTCMLLF